MENEAIMQAIIEKCSVYYDDALISDEAIIERYFRFFARQFCTTKKTTNFAFHTGSLCFDIASIAALLVGCLSYGLSSNDEILQTLDIGDMVLFKGERYHWGGIESLSVSKGSPKTDYIILHQDPKGRNGPSTSMIPYKGNKHLVKPYFGSSLVTDGRGIKRDKSNRNDFIAYVLGIPETDVPSTMDISVVVVADKNRFIDICKHLRIAYNGGKSVELTDIVPVSYYSSSGEYFQIGKNQSKAEAVIKATSKISMARDLVLDKHGSSIIGLLVSDLPTIPINSSELNDLLRRRTLRFALCTSRYAVDNVSFALEQYEEAGMFACTKELLSASSQDVKVSNKLTEELGRQIHNIVRRNIHTVHVDGGWAWTEYKSIKEKLFTIKQSNWFGEDRDTFVLSTIALINLFTTSFFSMNMMEAAITEEKINVAVVSPKSRLSELTDIALRTPTLIKQCLDVTQQLLDYYEKLRDSSPKGNALINYLSQNQERKIALIVPKAYYADLFGIYYQNNGNFRNVDCITANRFNNSVNYDVIVSVGDITGKKFDAIECFSAPELYVFLYESEGKLFNYRKNNYAKSEKKLNARIHGLKGEDYEKAVHSEEDDDDVREITLQEFADLDNFVDSMGMFDIRSLVSSTASNSGTTGLAEVKNVGTFTTGEKILFSKYYSAVVFDQNAGTVLEMSPEKLAPGDVLVFTKKNQYTRNIVDLIFDQLIKTRRLSGQVLDSAEKVFYWKEALREYKEKSGFTYRAVATELRKLGSSLQEVTIRQWLVDESQIVGPRDESTMEMIGEITQDPNILADTHGYFEACREIRHYRREILNLIAQAISDKLSNKEPASGSAFEIVFENIENLSETLELENIYELDEAENVNNNIVNRPIMEAEVLM
jgi:hypothetical protein